MSNFFKHKFRTKSLGEIIGIIIFGIIAAIGLAILFGFVIMWLWNWLIFILFKILLGGCAFGGKSSSKKSDCKKESKVEFSKWKHYDKFWKEQGNQAYEDYLERINNENNTDG